VIGIIEQMGVERDKLLAKEDDKNGLLLLIGNK
jgi:hypothetical protein